MPHEAYQVDDHDDLGLDVDAGREPEPYAGSNVDLPTPEAVLSRLLELANALDEPLAAYRQAVEVDVPAAKDAWNRRSAVVLTNSLRTAGDNNLRIRLDAAAPAEARKLAEAEGARDGARCEVDVIQAQMSALQSALRVVEAPDRAMRTAGRVTR